ncbi:MAG: hypothetical protein HYT61_00820 [Candidatus Yanofskybacteria bacterium]|nr:hypothetical protein [Candidatus Yanofskybacteria bacterium]
MNYHLYFHNDLDGMASGAVMLNFLRSRGDNIISFNPIDYAPEIYKGWVNYRFKKPFILLDFRYHSAASWWFDHHGTSFDSPSLSSWKKKYRNSVTHYRDPKCKSCCGMILFHLKKYFSFNAPSYIKELAKWADIIDSAGYKSARDALDYSKPAMQFSLFLSNDNNLKNRPSLLKKLAEKSLEEIVSEKSIKTKISQLISGQNKALQNSKKSSKLYKRAAFLDATNADSDYNHFMIYLAYPNIKYSVILEKTGNSYHLGVGKNPWVKSLGKVDVGNLMLRYCGGGHKNVGATQSSSKKEIVKIAEKVIEYLDNHE